MLVLTRKVGETIILDDGIEITLMDIQGNHIRINRSGSAISSSQSIGNSYFFTVFLRKSYSAVNSIKKSCTPKISCEMSE